VKNLALRAAFWVMLLAGVAMCTTGCATAPAGVSPVTRAACPELVKTPVRDMGELSLALIDTYQQYNECRRAALAIKE
jgi:hypothetical protein